MWWHFVDLSQDQKLERRRLLDLYGALAQVSALIPIAVLQIYFLTTWLQRRWSRGGNGGIPSSPHAKNQRSSSAMGWMVRLKYVWSKTLWWTGDTVNIWGSRVTNAEMVAGVVWSAWLILLSCVQTQGDYLHLTKRFGIVGASQLPLQYLLAFKSPFSPIQHLTACSWTSLNAAHQITSRVSILLIYLHAIFYLNFFIQAHVLTKRLKDWDVILGIIGTIAFSAVGTTALSWVRRWSYRLFYTTHVVLASILLPVLFFHVSHIRIYMVETCLIYIFHLALRKITEHKVSGSLTIIQGAANLVQVDIPISAKSAFMQWQPGQHVYISPASGSSYMRPFKSRSPFTVASLPSEDKNLRVVARVLDGNTAALAKAASECMAAGKDASIMPLVVEGPYGLSTHSRALLGYNRVLFIAGGVGATFIVPLYRTLLRDLSPSPGSRRRQKVAFVWVVRSEIETTWALPQDEQEKRGMQERMTVYATRGSATDGDEQKTGDMSADEIELEQLLPNGEGGEGGERGETGLAASQGWSVRDGRPNLGDVVDKTFSHTQEGGKVAVLICGPKSMADEVRRNSSKWAGKRDMWLHVEAYGL